MIAARATSVLSRAVFAQGGSLLPARPAGALRCEAIELCSFIKDMRWVAGAWGSLVWVLGLSCGPGLSMSTRRLHVPNSTPERALTMPAVMLLPASLSCTLSASTSHSRSLVSRPAAGAYSQTTTSDSPAPGTASSNGTAAGGAKPKDDVSGPMLEPSVVNTSSVGAHATCSCSGHHAMAGGGAMGWANSGCQRMCAAQQGLGRRACTMHISRKTPSLTFNHRSPEQVRTLAALAAFAAAAGSTAFLPARLTAFMHITAYGIWLGTNIWWVGITTTWRPLHGGQGRQALDTPCHQENAAHPAPLILKAIMQRCHDANCQCQPCLATAGTPSSWA